MEKIELGHLVEDVLTGYTGVVTAYAVYMHNCDRVAIRSKELKDGLPQEAIWFDLPQIELISDIKVINITPPVEHDFQLGDLVEDTLSDYEGVITEFVTFSNGCVRAGVQSREMKDGQPVDSIWFPVQQLELVESVAEPVETTKRGGPMRSPSAPRSPR